MAARRLTVRFQVDADLDQLRRQGDHGYASLARDIDGEERERGQAGGRVMPPGWPTPPGAKEMSRKFERFQLLPPCRLIAL